MGNLSIYDSTFTNNIAWYKGGAIYFDGGYLYANGSNFTNNLAIGGNALTDSAGGGICVDSAILTIFSQL